MTTPRSHRRRDVGSILPLVMLVAILLSAVVVALARLVTTDLAAGRVTEARAERQATALSAIDYAIERLRNGATLCDATVPSFGQVALGVVDLNGATDVSITCDRPVPHVAAGADWAAIVTGEGAASDQLHWDGSATGQIEGRVFVSDPSAITIGTATVEQRDGDLWYDEVDCTSAGAALPSAYVVVPDTAYGPRCTTNAWDELVAEPSIVAEPAAVPEQWNGTCKVFSPGRYSTAPDLGPIPDPVPEPRPGVYFNSGVYVFDDVGDIVITDQPVWFGHHGATTPSVANPDCEAARDVDPQASGPGAVIYLAGNSRIVLSGTANVELFGAAVDTQQVSIHQRTTGVDASTVVAAADEALVSIASGPSAVVAHGLVYAPEARLDLEAASGASVQRFLGGVVAAQLWLRADTDANTDLAVTSGARDLTIAVTATATDERGTTTARAVIQYRPDEPDAMNRITVLSMRVVD